MPQIILLREILLSLFKLIDSDGQIIFGLCKLVLSLSFILLHSSFNFLILPYLVLSENIGILMILSMHFQNVFVFFYPFVMSLKFLFMLLHFFIEFFEEDIMLSIKILSILLILLIESLTGLCKLLTFGP